MSKLKTITKIGVGIVLVGVAVDSILFKVNTGHRAIIFDRFQGVKPHVIGEGIHFMVPWLHQPIFFDIRTQSCTFAVSFKSKDLQTVNISLLTLFRPNAEILPAIYLNFGPDFEKRILPSIINEVVKAIVAQFDASELNSQRTMVSKQITKILIERANQFGIILDDISIVIFLDFFF